MNEMFWCYTFPMLVLAAMVAWNDIATEIQFCKLEKRIRELEQAEEGET